LRAKVARAGGKETYGRVRRKHEKGGEEVV
jgi:hypothetical protein